MESITTDIIRDRLAKASTLYITEIHLAVQLPNGKTSLQAQGNTPKKEFVSKSHRCGVVDNVVNGVTLTGHLGMRCGTAGELSNLVR